MALHLFHVQLELHDNLNVACETPLKGASVPIYKCVRTLYCKNTLVQHLFKMEA